MSNMNDSVDNGNAGGDLVKKSISRRDMLKLSWSARYFRDCLR